ncbi:MAG TPA: hypothetical protein VFC56_16165 [Stellaceae bacterium]|nr:hypothetical protein [Stellaceae bacterium]
MNRVLLDRIRQHAYQIFSIAACLSFFALTCDAADKVNLSQDLTTDELRCLHELLDQSYSRAPPDPGEISELVATAQVGRANLNPNRSEAYIYLFSHPGWCGSAGCLLIIGEDRSDGRCRMLYDDGNGFEQAIKVSAGATTDTGDFTCPARCASTAGTTTRFMRNARTSTYSVKEVHHQAPIQRG